MQSYHMQKEDSTYANYLRCHNHNPASNSQVIHVCNKDRKLIFLEIFFEINKYTKRILLRF